MKKKNNNTFSILKKQLKVLSGNKINVNKIIVAYEPVWSIGTNKIPKIDKLEEIIKFIKNQLIKILKIKKLPNILYGGSVNDKNVHLFSKLYHLDGFLVGGASQSSKKFIDIVDNYYK